MEEDKKSKGTIYFQISDGEMQELFPLTNLDQEIYNMLEILRKNNKADL